MANTTLTVNQAAMYYGCEVMCADGTVHKLDTRVLKHIEDGNTQQCQLLLTPYADMRPEHAAAVAGCLGVAPSRDVVIHLLDYHLKSESRLTPDRWRMAFTVLRKYRYDCDNAIAEGWAIDKSSLAK